MKTTPGLRTNLKWLCFGIVLFRIQNYPDYTEYCQFGIELITIEWEEHERSLLAYRKESNYIIIDFLFFKLQIT